MSSFALCILYDAVHAGGTSMQVVRLCSVGSSIYELWKVRQLCLEHCMAKALPPTFNSVLIISSSFADSL